jgi:Tol biopolymer transport system component
MKRTCAWLATALTLAMVGCSAGPSASALESSPSAPAVPSGTASPSVSEVASVTPPNLDGRIIFTRAGGDFGDETVFAANANGTNEQRLTEFGSSCCIWATRDGSRIAYAAYGERVSTATANFDGSDKVVAQLPESLSLGPGPFSPDGQQIAFEGFNDASPADGGIYIGSTDGANLVRITQRAIPGDWSPDGAQVLFFIGSEGDPPPAGTLFVVNVDGTSQRQITPDNVEVACCFNFRWSPDGSRILFADQGGVLWLIDPDGTGLTQLFKDTEGRYAITPTWSPDGTKVMFALDPTSNQFSHPVNGLYVIDADGSGLTLVLGGDDFKRAPYWVP